MIRHIRAARLRRLQRKAVPLAALATAPVTFAEEKGEVEARLAEIPLREMVELIRIDLPTDELEPLLELGLLPGCQLCPVRRSPFGDPVLMVDGSLIALRREMARCLCVRRAIASGAH